MTITAPPPGDTTGGGQAPHQLVDGSSQPRWATAAYIVAAVLSIVAFGPLVLIAGLIIWAIGKHARVGKFIFFIGLFGTVWAAILFAIMVEGVLQVASSTGTPASAPSYRVTMDPTQGPVLVQSTPQPSHSPDIVPAQPTANVNHNGDQLAPGQVIAESSDDSPLTVLNNVEKIRQMAIDQHDIGLLGHAYAKDSPAWGDNSVFIVNNLPAPRYTFTQVKVVSRTSSEMVVSYTSHTSGGSGPHRAHLVFRHGEWLVNEVEDL